MHPRIVSAVLIMLVPKLFNINVDLDNLEICTHFNYICHNCVFFIHYEYRNCICNLALPAFCRFSHNFYHSMIKLWTVFIFDRDFSTHCKGNLVAWVDLLIAILQSLHNNYSSIHFRWQNLSSTVNHVNYCRNTHDTAVVTS